MEMPPNHPKSELAAAVARGLLGMVPIAGGLISELANQLNPLEKRKHVWASHVASAITEIEERFELLPQSLIENEAFVSVVIEATRIAIKNHRAEKLSALRNALVSSAASGANIEDVVFHFLRYIDEMTVTHIRLLSCFCMHTEKFRGLSEVDKIINIAEKILEEKLPRPSFRSFISDLENAYMIRAVDLKELPEDGPTPEYILGESSPSGIWVTPQGKSFLEFISGTNR